MRDDVVEIPLGTTSRARLHGIALVDATDYELVAPHLWSIRVAPRLLYAQTSARRSDGRPTCMQMHRLIIPGVTRIDHRDGNGLNNTRANLRAATSAENNHNRRSNIGTTSIYKGVCRIPADRWRAYIWVRSRQHSLGCFVSETAAARAYDAAAREAFGAYARVNFPGTGEQPALLR